MRLRKAWDSIRQHLAASLSGVSNLRVLIFFHAAMAIAARTLSLTFRILRWVLFGSLLIVVLIFGIGYVVFNTDRDIAYRYAKPDSAECRRQDETPVEIAAADAKRDNDEFEVKSPDIREALACMVQVHQVRPPPEKAAVAKPIRFHLAFLEFTEAGDPAETDPSGRTLEVNQLDALLKHLRDQRQKGKHNYVIAFIHGWRHNANIGDGDVQKLRTLAAYATNFLAQRCEFAKRNCDTVVTAVYFGWRGARVDEDWARRRFGKTVGAILDPLFGSVPALLTLFDRKPVSERIGPSAITALRRLDDVTFDRHSQGWKRDPEGRMITFGHSLGGNMLASALRDTVVDRIRRHVPGTVMPPPFGNLIVLINPASEAANWTVLQRAVRERVRFVYPVKDSNVESEIARETSDIVAGHDFFPDHQPPIYVTLSSANTWPAGGIRKGDEKYLKKMLFDQKGAATQVVKDPAKEAEACQELLHRNEIVGRPHYDWATHDLFPAFKFDFRPVAQTLENYASSGGAGDLCHLSGRKNRFLMGMAAFLRNLPFMNTDVEQTTTIGHLIPMRAPLGSLRNSLVSSTNYGATHELIVNAGLAKEVELKAAYRNAADPALTECAVVDGWLWRARSRSPPNGMFWDSGATGGRASPHQNEANLTPVRLRPTIEQGRLESQFRHNLLNSGMAPVVRANDPFWNVRVFETAMRDHGDYVSYPLICAIQQLVMDDVARPSPPPQ